MPRTGVLLTIARFCARCGVPNPSGIETCSACGASLRLEPTAPAPPLPPPNLWAASAPPRRATVGSILGDTFSVFGKDLPTYVLVYLLYGAATTGLSLALSLLVFGFPFTGVPGAPGFSTLLLVIAFTVGIAVVDLIIASIVTASLTHFALQRYRGAPATLGDAFGVGGRRFLSVLGASLVQGLLLTGLLAVGLVVLLFGALTLDLGLMCGGGLLVLVLLPVAIYVAIALSLYAPAIVVEGRSAIAGLRRSWELTRGRRLTLFLVLLVLGLMTAAISVAVSLPFAFVPGEIGPEIGGVIATAITGSWVVIMGAVAYHLIGTESTWAPVPGYAPPPLWGPPRA